MRLLRFVSYGANNQAIMPIVVTIREDVYPLARFQDNPDTLYNKEVYQNEIHFDTPPLGWTENSADWTNGIPKAYIVRTNFAIIGFFLQESSLRSIVLPPHQKPFWAFDEKELQRSMMSFFI